MKLVKAMATVAGMTGLSRIAGFARDILTAAYLGAGPVGDAFFVALKLPNFFRRVTAEGAFSIAFVPLYSKMIEQEELERSRSFVSNAFMVMLTLISVITLIAVAFMPYVIQAIAPGFADDPERYELAVEFSRITFPYLLLMSLTALLGGVLNAHNKFAPFAFAPVLFNVSLITALVANSNFDTVGHALSWGLLCAGFLQLVFLFVCFRRAGLNLRFTRPVFDVDIKRVFTLMGPAVIGAGVVHINLFADLILASFLDSGSISYLYYADRLNQLPLGVVGIAVGTALLPMLSRAMTKENKGEAQGLFNRSLEYCLLLALPASVALLVIPLPLITVLFERGAFSVEDSLVTASILQAYALGLPMYVTIKVFSTAHWAREDTKTPVRISVVATILNIIFSIVLIQFIGVIGIALATGLMGWLQFYMHIQALKSHDCAQLDKRFKGNAVRIIAASCIMGGVAAILAALFAPYIYGAVVLAQIAALAVVIIGAMIVYAISIIFLGVVDLGEIKNFVRRR